MIFKKNKAPSSDFTRATETETHRMHAIEKLRVYSSSTVGFSFFLSFSAKFCGRFFPLVPVIITIIIFASVHTCWSRLPFSFDFSSSSQFCGQNLENRERSANTLLFSSKIEWNNGNMCIVRAPKKLHRTRSYRAHRKRQRECVPNRIVCEKFERKKDKVWLYLNVQLITFFIRSSLEYCRFCLHNQQQAHIYRLINE